MVVDKTEVNVVKLAAPVELLSPTTNWNFRMRENDLN